MKKFTQKSITVLLIVTLGIVANAAINDKRLRLKNGKSKSNVTLNPSRTYKFVISGKEFKKLSVALQTKGGKIQVLIKSPSGKTLSKGTGKNFTIRNAKKAETGDFQIILRNVGKSLVSVGIVVGEIQGESR